MPINKEEIRAHYNSIADAHEAFIRIHAYYHRAVARYYQFCIPKGFSVLELGCSTGELLSSLEPSYGIGVDISEEMVMRAKKKYPHLNFICQDIETLTLEGKFDYIIISGTLACLEDIQQFLIRIQAFCHPQTRIIINYYNHLWESLLLLGEKLHLKIPETHHNWLSIDDIKNFLHISGYEVIRYDFDLLLPIYIPLVSTLLNKTIGKLPGINRLCLSQFAVARLDIPPGDPGNLIASVVITCRDEKGNIEELVQRTPSLGVHTEIIFVEGHSRDGTREEIERVITQYPQKDIKLLIQDGIGQGDALRKGFDHAKGDFILLLEADLTTPPEELCKFWDTYCRGRCEYANGTRLVYQMQKTSMPVINFIGNRFFGNLFTWLLGQRFTDTLCGLKAITRQGYERIRRERGFFGDFDPFGDFEIIFGAVKNNLKVADIPVQYFPRHYGITKTKPFRHGWLLLKMCAIAFRRFKLL
ncbi:MAG: glycosyltransferase [Candidatus Omnitrophica bacterium]|nr:glycosyltransferase [Candidatus Omnitrophota bacterium]